VLDRIIGKKGEERTKYSGEKKKAAKQENQVWLHETVCLTLSLVFFKSKKKDSQNHTKTLMFFRDDKKTSRESSVVQFFTKQSKTLLQFQNMEGETITLPARKRPQKGPRNNKTKKKVSL
jgi:hypothetical protein